MTPYARLLFISFVLCALQPIALGNPTRLKSHDWPLKRTDKDVQDLRRKTALRQGLARKSARSVEDEVGGSPANRIASAPVATRSENSNPKKRISWNDLVQEIGTVNSKPAEKRENAGDKEVTNNPAAVSSAAPGAQLSPGNTPKPMAGGACAGGAGAGGGCAGKCPSSSTEKPSPPPPGVECPSNLDTMFVCPKCRTHYTVKINVRESKCGHCCGVPIPCCDDAKVNFAGPFEVDQQIANYHQVQARARKQMKRTRLRSQDGKRPYLPKADDFRQNVVNY